MKLNTLLLTSAATLMTASVAFAADLPSKKAAPAAGSVQVCKVGGMTGMTLPGSDTCFGLSGWVRANFNYDLNSESEDETLDWNAWGGSYRVQADFRSNTEIGVVRGVGRLTDGDMDKAYIQFAGLTAGKKDSIADIFGTNSINFGAWTQGADGIDYKLSAGGLTFGIAAETPVNNNSSADASGDRPDLVAHVLGKAGPVDFPVAAVSHEASDWYNYDGHALLGRLGVSMNNVSLYTWGATAEDASGYVGNSFNGVEASDGDDFREFRDVDDGTLHSTVWGLGATFTQGAITVGAEYARYNHEDDDAEIETDDIAVFATYRIAKNLTVTGEYYQSRATEVEFLDTDQTGSVDTFYVRIQRDF